MPRHKPGCGRKSPRVGAAHQSPATGIVMKVVALLLPKTFSLNRFRMATQRDAALAPLRFVFAFRPPCICFSCLRNLSTAACSAGSVIGSATTRCKGAILGGTETFLVIAPSSWENTIKHSVTERERVGQA